MALHAVSEQHYSAPDATERAEALNATEAFIRRFVVVSQAQSTTITLWLAHTHCIEAFDCTPYLAITSEQKRSGKTRLLEVLELLARKPLRTSDMTEAALFHMLSNGASTLLLDECDTIFRSRKSNEGMRALLNAGYRRGSPIRRMKGGHLESYDVFCPKVLAGIGNLPDTVMDRSVVIKLERKRPAEDVERFRHADAASDAAVVHAKLARCFHPVAENVEWLQGLAVARPHLPEWLNDRAQDSWECLLAIAEAVGGGWSERAVRATQELSAEPVTIR